MKSITIFHLKIIIFTAVKYHSILHGHVCVMGPFASSCPHAGLSEFSFCALYDHKFDSGFYKDGIKSSTMGVAMSLFTCRLSVHSHRVFLQMYFLYTGIAVSMGIRNYFC